MSVAEVVYDKYTEIALEIQQRGWCVWPAFIDAAHARELAADALALREAGEFRHAGVGRGDSFQVRPEIRSDYVHWLQPGGGLSPAQARYLEQLEQLRQALNRELWLGLFEFEGHLAIYPAGSFYARHLDQFAGVAYRLVTCVLYLNPAWQQADGGQLRLYFGTGEQETHLDVSPHGGTLVCFLSGEIEHEVLPTARERISITGWFRRRE